MSKILFATATHDYAILSQNLGASEVLKTHPLAILHGFESVPAAYNSLIASAFDWVVFVHHDVFLPPDFEASLRATLAVAAPDWAILGVAGVNLENGVRTMHGNLIDRGRPWGRPDDLPCQVRTLDEVILIVRGTYRWERAFLQFDPRFPFDFYGADLCMQAEARGLRCMAIHAPIVHNSTRPFGGRTAAFYDAEEAFRQKWYNQLPVATTCAVVSKNKSHVL